MEGLYYKLMEMSMSILTLFIAYFTVVFLLFSRCISFHHRMRFNADEQRPLLKHAIILTLTLESWERMAPVNSNEN
jgi:hypothetical protein